MKKIKTNYKLIDCGKREKLEQFGDFIIRRPSPQAVWPKKLPSDIWDIYQSRYDEKKNEWLKDQYEDLPRFQINNLKLTLKYSSQRQLGIFPEQLPNWQWLDDYLAHTERSLKIFNGFAYTGAASTVAACAAGGRHQITHLDATPASVKWAQGNYALNSSKQNVRWITDDIITFMQREVKRGNKYDAFILDPPAFGRTKKATWKIGRDLPKLLQIINQLLSSDPKFIILSSHDKDFPAKKLAEELLRHCDLPLGKLEKFALKIPSETGNPLPAGESIRWVNSQE